jgi:hypothetical protein
MSGLNGRGGKQRPGGILVETIPWWYTEQRARRHQILPGLCVRSHDDCTPNTRGSISCTKVVYFHAGIAMFVTFFVFSLSLSALSVSRNYTKVLYV